MYGVRSEFLPRPTFAEEEYRAVGGRQKRNSFVDLLHHRRIADHVVTQIDFMCELAVLRLQPLHVPNVFQSKRRNSCDSRRQLQMGFIKRGFSGHCCEVNNADRSIHDE